MPRVEAVYLVHHSHTDVGYTHDQPVVWDLYRRFLEEAIDLAARDADREGDDAFRWTVENTFPLLHWLETARPERVRLFRDLCLLGRVEVTAMPCNITPLYDTAEVLASLEPVRRLRAELGIPVRHAMQSDVNGHNWPLVEALLDAGIEGFSMAINVDHGGAPPGRPNAFRWQGPSGRDLLAWNGWSYGFAWGLGIGHSAERLAARWPEVAAYLDSLPSPLPAVMMQLFSGFGDNGPPIRDLSAFVRAWNASGRAPRLVLATPAMWWDLVRRHAAELPVWRGDWTDFWNFGAGSSAFETALGRASRARLDTADRLEALVGSEADPRRHAPAGTRERAWRALFLWDEHTWGADVSCSHPDDPDTRVQWAHKAAYAYEARSLSQLLLRDAVAELARRVAREAGDALLAFNPLPEPRRAAGPVPDWRPEAQRGGADDPSSARHFWDRTVRPAAAWLLPTEVPGCGYAVVPGTSLRAAADGEVGQDAEVGCGRFRLVFDRERGGIVSWRDRELDRELVDPSSGWPLHGFVHERPAEGRGREALWSWPAQAGRLELERGWHPDWPAERHGPTRVLEHRVERTPVGVRVIQRLEAPGVDDLVQATTLVEGVDAVLLESSWRMRDTRSPEATYLAFPLALRHPVVRFDAGGQAVRPEEDQLPGVCRDYFTVQTWVDLEGAEGGVTVATPDTPLWQFGGFSFAANRARFALERPLLLAWVTNNYWHTNFRASQPGRVFARFWLRPYRGPFDEAAAHRFGLEAALPVVFHHLGESVVPGGLWPRRGHLLELPAPPVLVLALRPDPDGGVVLRLWNASDRPQAVRVGPGLLRVVRAARADVLGEAREVLPVEAGGVSVELGPRRLGAVRLWLARA
jgi:alpha-mannosidase